MKCLIPCLINESKPRKPVLSAQNRSNENQETQETKSIPNENQDNQVSNVAPPSLAITPSVSDSFSSSTPLKILIVDDSMPIQKCLKRWLEAHGCTVTSAPNGKVGLQFMCTEKFDITLMDFLMVSCPLIQ
jgi:PleD family two-component response regulator